MAETETTTAPETGTTGESQVADTTTATDVVAPDLPQGYDAFIPEDFKGMSVYKTFTDLPSLLKLVGNQARVIVRAGKGIQAPPPDATQTEKDMFFEAIGRPKLAAEYKMDVPKEVADYFDAATVSDTKDMLHKAGLTQAQFNAVMALDAKRLQTGMAQLEAEQKAEREQAEKDLHTAWGVAFDEKMHIVNRMIAENVPEPEREALLAVVGNNKVVAQLLASIGTKFMEARSVSPDSESGGKMTPGEAKTRSLEVAAELGLDQNSAASNPGKHARLLQEYDTLVKMSLAGQ